MNLVVLDGKILVEGEDYATGLVKDGEEYGFRLRNGLLKEGSVLQTFFSALMMSYQDVYDILRNDDGELVVRKRPKPKAKHCSKCKKLIVGPQLADEEEELCEVCGD